MCHHEFRLLVVRKTATKEGSKNVGIDRRSGAGHNYGHHSFAKIWMGHAHHRRFLHALKTVDNVFYFFGIDVVAAGDNQVF